MSSNIRHVSYSLWDEIATNNPSWSNYHYKKGDDYEITTGNREHVFVSYVVESDLAAWTADFLPTSTAVTEKDDAVVRVMGILNLASTPNSPDGKSEVINNPARVGMNTWLTGAGDDISAGPSGRGKGTKMKIQFLTTDTNFPLTKTAVLQFLEPIEIHDGQANWGPDNASDEWGPDDEFEFSAEVPATSPTSDPGAGNVDEVVVPNTGGTVKIYTPNASTTGSHTLDISDYTKSCPVASNEDTGYWDVDYFTGVISAAAVPGPNKYNMYNISFEKFIAVSMPMMAFVRRYDPDIYKVEWFHQSYKMKLSVTKNSAPTIDSTVCGIITGFRAFIQRA